MLADVSILRHHPRNEEIYTLSNIDDLVQSIGEVGLLSPLVIDKSNQVISGNRRLGAVRKLGWDQVEVEVADVPDEDVVSILIAYNKQRVKNTREVINEYRALEKIYKKGQGRRSDLEPLLESNRGETGRDIISKKLGLSSSQVQRLLFIDKEDSDFVGHIDAGTLTINQAYTALKKRVADTSIISTKSGSSGSVETDDYTFHHKSSQHMHEIDNETVQLVFTSPPYFQQRKYSDGDEVSLGHEDTPQEYVENLVDHLADVHRVLRKDGSFFLVIGDKFQDMNLLNLPHRVAISLQDRGWIQRQSIVWRKTNPKMSSSKSNLSSSYEMIFHFTKTTSYLYQPIRIPAIGNKGKPAEIGKVMGKIGHNNLTHDKTDHSYWPYISDGKKGLTDFWTEEIVETAVASHNGSKDKKSHPAAFNHKLVVVPLLQTTRPNDLVCDPFHGSGTTGDVATAYGRRYVAYDVKTY